MAMEAAVDIDSAGDFSVHSSHSGVGSRSRSSAYSSAGITGVDVESGEAALLAGAKGHRSTYAKLAEEALLGAAGRPSDPEIAPGEFHEATASAWRMGSPGAFWRLDSGGAPLAGALASARGRGPEDASKRRPDRITCKTIWWAPVVAGILSIALLTVCWNIRSRLSGNGEASAEYLQKRGETGCCTGPTATCYACMAGVSIEAFCYEHGRALGIHGCVGDFEGMESGRAAAATWKGGGPEDTKCCTDTTAHCLACKDGVSALDYCSDAKHHSVDGCGGEKCGLVEYDVEYSGGDLYSVGGVASATKCCDVCREEPKCTSWSWGGNRPGSVFKSRCFLKRQSELKVAPVQGYVSGLPGGDRGEFHLKNRHGICLELTHEQLELQACSSTIRTQRFVYERRLGWITAGQGKCVQAPAAAGGDIAVRPCSSTKKGQTWAYNSTTGKLRSGDGLCLHAVKRSRKGAKVQAKKCHRWSEEQQWSFWSSQLIGQRATIEAMREEALEPTSTTRTQTTTTVVSTSTSTQVQTLFCFSVMVSWGYEPKLVAMQSSARGSIFACDASAVYSDKEVELDDGNVKTRRVEGTDLKCHKGGIFNTLLNTPVFKKVWEQVVTDGVFKHYDWTIKVDCDAVFFPDRLRMLISGPALVNAQAGRGVFLNNCAFGLHGPIEVMSNMALTTYAKGFEECDDPPQEDVYLQACMNKLGAKQVNQFTLLSEEACRTPNWQTCQSSHVSFHPFKDIDAYQACQTRAERREVVHVKKK